MKKEKKSDGSKENRHWHFELGLKKERVESDKTHLDEVKEKFR